MMMGLTVATVIGVPLATWLGQHFGWRAGFEFSATIAFFTLIAVACFVPNIPVQATASIKTELAGLKNINISAVGHRDGDWWFSCGLACR
ncbi:major facilitator superfamily permease [Acinetobacter baumannii]|nr:major facilitator superfamily permease [Acinetobacter baumannii]